MPRTEKHRFHIKRVYQDSSPDDGVRFLVDGIWPRGITKSALASATWLRDVAPSAALRKWYGHDPAKWPEFQKRYRAELQSHSAACGPILEAIKHHEVTLLFATKDPELSNAAVLKTFLEEKAHQTP